MSSEPNSTFSASPLLCKKQGVSTMRVFLSMRRWRREEICAGGVLGRSRITLSVAVVASGRQRAACLVLHAPTRFHCPVGPLSVPKRWLQGWVLEHSSHQWLAQSACCIADNVTLRFLLCCGSDCDTNDGSHIPSYHSPLSSAQVNYLVQY